MTKKAFLLILILAFIQNIIGAIEIKRIRSIILNQKSGHLIVFPNSFFVTTDDVIYIMDKEVNIKIFNETGRFIRFFGRRGQGPNEFLNITTSSYKKDRFMIYDAVAKKLIFFNQTPGNAIEETQRINFFGMSNNFKFMDNEQILISGISLLPESETKQIFYSLYIYNIFNCKYTNLLTSIDCYGVKSDKEFQKLLIEKIRLMPSLAFADFSQDYFFYVNTLDIKVIRLDRKTGKKFIFGNKTPNYIAPFVTPEMDVAIKKRNNKMLFQYSKGMSFIVDLFMINQSNLGLIYTSYKGESDRTDVIMQIYDISGRFIEERVLLHAKTEDASGLKSFYLKEKKNLYILDTEALENSDEKYILNKFGINE